MTQNLVDGLSSADVGTNLCNTGNGCGETITAYSQGGGAGFMICGSSYRGHPFRTLFLSSSNRARIAGTIIAELRDRCQAPDSNGDIRAGGIQRVHYSDDISSEISSDVKLFTRPGQIDPMMGKARVAWDL
ncbi:hypothetical protein ASPSYDRAFT_66287 [Aspergillus sydowii CBS 593.65]|uniref:Uncharacterized protein n=1 Tax=Aspergillus sydowii CBS 593.65 TaxID=1036612 RepID=A0A1L9TLL3_9EURO|nr:uncharacterized protein ASPSYDRAFT_66287 [Aspergillus sydowii CBS 593.65]OJJ60319.1 hypothetical protein ASPSYDRAFT_66287 [Aspergillus sydowii CBS 593.65]